MTKLKDLALCEKKSIDLNSDQKIDGETTSIHQMDEFIKNCSQNKITIIFNRKEDFTSRNTQTLHQKFSERDETFLNKFASPN